MASIKVISGPEVFIGKEFPISTNVRETEAVFMGLAKAECFWTVNLLGLTDYAACEVKIMDFSARCARSICMKIPIFVDGKRTIVLSISKKSVDNALHKIINLLLVSDGNMIVVEDSSQRLAIDMVLGDESDDFADGTFFANA